MKARRERREINWFALIMLAIIGNIVYLAHNTTKDFLKTTNSSRSSESSASSSYGYTGGMKITNSNNKKE